MQINLGIDNLASDFGVSSAQANEQEPAPLLDGKFLFFLVLLNL